MASSRFYGLLAVITGLFLASCAGAPNTIECSTGVLCPEGMQCAAFQPVCLVTPCGNGKLDPGEVCDDGNIIDGDGCSSNCLSAEKCGNGVIDHMAGEICDDGNTVGGDGCSADCKSTEICGNGIRDVGEACDDGNTIDADGCSANCMSTEVCGNGKVDTEVGEVCDDGNTVSGDGCNADCRSGEGCGNGILDPGEECDDGNMSDNDDCLHTCKRNVCGDGIINANGTHKETCDAGTTGTPVETTTCNLDCTVASCGDGKVNRAAGEECDDGFGNNKDTNNCVASCKLNICGDGKVDMQPPRIEQCDDGNTNNADGCNNACQLASCGNGQLDPGEQCDDGNNITTDSCVACHNAVCGDGFIEAGIEQCDDGNKTSGDGCSSSCRTEGCGNGVLDPGEQCDDGNLIQTDACLNNCVIAVCGDGNVRSGVEQCDDGNKVNGDGCSATCLLEGCGNGTLDPGEQCDDGNKTSGDGCSSTCQFEGCGDGVVNNGEACDTGGESVTCNADCTLARCGDSKVNAHAGEQCDVGAANSDNKDCTAGCKINVCGDGHPDTMGSIAKREQCDDGNTINNDGCSNACMLGSCGNGVIDPGEECDDMNNDSSDGCANCRYARCGDGFIELGHEQCDTNPVVVMGVSRQCSMDCKIQICGNGIIDPGEECDAGGNNSDSGKCTTLCKVAVCGDGFTNGNETCDPTASGGNIVSGSPSCNFDCTFGSPHCGDNVVNVNVGEQCDDGNLTNGDGCNSNCQHENCGNGRKENQEECDGTDGVGPFQSCDAKCHLVFCGNGVKDPLEGCDDGNTVTEDCLYGTNAGSCIVCKADCTLGDGASHHVCGDGVTDSGHENCDNGMTGTALKPANGLTGCNYNVACTTCSSNCQTTTAPTVRNCGDHTIDVDGGEVCDLGGQNITGTTPAACTTYNGTCVECLGDAVGNSCKVLTVVQGPYCGDGICDDGNMGRPAGGETLLNCNRDCPSTCGNGIVEPGEKCDGSVDCSTFNSRLTGSATCATTGVTMCQVLDTTGCVEIAPVCGNNVVEDSPSTPAMSEVCDDGGVTALVDGTCTPTPAYGGSCIACKAGCQSEKVVLAPFCGDGIINGTGPNAELCDGATLNLTDTCATVVVAGSTGTLKCASTCKAYDTTACTRPATCTDGLHNGNESDVDCGGTCSKCANAKMCYVNVDCTSNICTTGVCQAMPPPPPPAAPTGVAAASTIPNKITVSWTASVGATSYNVKSSTTMSGPYTLVGSPTGTTFTDIGLMTGTPYFYVVTAVGVGGESGNSTEVTATPM